MARAARHLGAAASLVAVAALLSSCGNHDVSIPGAVALDSGQKNACQAFVAALPSTVAKQKPRTVSPSDALGRAYGDPAITVRCGATVPSTYSAGKVSAVLTVVSYTPVVQLVVPAGYRPQGPFLAMGELSPLVKKYLTPSQRCA